MGVALDSKLSTNQIFNGNYNESKFKQWNKKGQINVNIKGFTEVNMT